MQDPLTDDSKSEKRNTFFGWVEGNHLHRSRVTLDMQCCCSCLIAFVEHRGNTDLVLCEIDETFSPTPSISNGAM